MARFIFDPSKEKYIAAQHIVSACVVKHAYSDSCVITFSCVDGNSYSTEPFESQEDAESSLHCIMRKIASSPSDIVELL